MIFLAQAGVSRCSPRVTAAVQAHLQRVAEDGVGSVTEALAMRARLKQKLGRLLGTSEQNLVLTGGTSWGILAIAQNFPWERGDRVGLIRGEFPTNVTPWQQAARQHGLEVVWLDADLATLQQELDHGLRLLAFSAVQFQTGLRLPWEAITRRCHSHGCQVFVDAIQAVGIVPLCVGEIDYLAGGAHKWLGGLEGCGYLYVSPQRLDSLQRHWSGWLSHQDPVRFLLEGPGELRYDRPLLESVGYLEVGSSSAVSQFALEASLEEILEVGVESIFAHVDMYLNCLEEALQMLGFESLRQPQARSGILSLRPPRGDVGQWNRLLLEQQVRISTPDGLLRVAPHWSNPVDQVELVVRAFQAVLAQV